jgi:hypothetical protein
VYVAKGRDGELTQLVNPNGKGCTNDVNRAELAAIHAALLTLVGAPRLTIYTDSQVSLHYIARQLHRPHTLLECKHRDLLSMVVDALRARSRARMVPHAPFFEARCQFMFSVGASPARTDSRVVFSLAGMAWVGSGALAVGWLPIR